jgi:NAD(P)-dependent dehydrogenase (short-subunit alcohol dehydrogenase family)
MEIDLRNNIILLTGATGGIGETAARLLGKNGATVAIHFNKHSRSAEKLAGEIGNNSKAFQADLSDPKNGAVLFGNVVTAFGRVDTLVNNAGVWDGAPIEKDIDEWLSVWNKNIAINLTSVGVLCREAIRHFKKQGGGRIINIASRAAFRGDTEEYFAYAAAKGGMVALSRSIARAYGKANIKSFVIAPGWVRTEMTDEYFKEHGESSALNEIALPKLTEPGDVAPTILFLASGLMDHATGATIDINAGSYVR